MGESLRNAGGRGDHEWLLLITSLSGQNYASPLSQGTSITSCETPPSLVCLLTDSDGTFPPPAGMACRSIERLNLEGFLYSVLPCHSALACMLHCVHALPRLLELRAAALATGLAPSAHTQAVVEAAAAIVGGLARAAPSLPAGGAAAHGAGALVVAGAQMEEWRLGRSLLSPVVLSFMCDRLEAVRKTNNLHSSRSRAPASLLPSRCSVCPLAPQLLIQLQDAEAHRRLPPVVFTPHRLP